GVAFKYKNLKYLFTCLSLCINNLVYYILLGGNLCANQMVHGKKLYKRYYNRNVMLKLYIWNSSHGTILSHGYRFFYKSLVLLYLGIIKMSNLFHSIICHEN
ncbi:hypothetical protein ACJX0J_012991, partial [Zea mays]